ncbi:MAG: hypothetical protein ACOY9Y_10745 [Bacillota bacterium]
MAKVYQFPNQSTRALIHTVIQLYAAGKWTRQQMMSQVHDTLKSYGITRLDIDNYTVRVAEPVVTSIGKFPVIIIEAKQISESLNCPACRNARDAGYLTGDAIVTVMCRRCGCIYSFHARKEESL